MLVLDPRPYMPKKLLPGWPAPLALIWFTTGVACSSATVANALVATEFSGKSPILAGVVKLYLTSAPAVAVAPVLGVAEPVAPVVLVPDWVRWMTRNTISTTPTTDEAR